MYRKNFSHDGIIRGLYYLNIDMAIGIYQVQKVFLRLSETKNRGMKEGIKGKSFNPKTTTNSEEPEMELSCGILHGTTR
jgi:hypothetical protein